MQRAMPSSMRPENAPLPGLDRTSGVPLYLQIEEQVRRLLADGPPADRRVFTEQALSRRFGVSRMTVRQAIRDLVHEGLIYRVRGAGTFLASPKVTESLDSLHDNFEAWEAQGRNVALRVIELAMVEAGTDVARRLRVPERTAVQHLVRLWVVDGSPIGLVHFYLHPSVSGRLSRADLERTHVRVALARRLRIPIRGEQVEIEAGAASAAIADRLTIPPGDPVLIRRVTQFYGDGKPLVAANCYYRADQYRYAVYVPAKPVPTEGAFRPRADRPVTVQEVAGARGVSTLARARRPPPQAPMHGTTRSPAARAGRRRP